MAVAGSVQNLVAIIGAIGGLGGVAAGLGVFLQRRKFKAEAADVLTDTALTLVQPLKDRIREVESEFTTYRQQMRVESTEARADVRSLRAELAVAFATLRRWKRAILNPDVSRDELVSMAESEDFDTEREHS